MSSANTQLFVIINLETRLNKLTYHNSELFKRSKRGRIHWKQAEIIRIWALWQIIRLKQMSGGRWTLPISVRSTPGPRAPRLSPLDPAPAKTHINHSTTHISWPEVIFYWAVFRKHYGRITFAYLAVIYVVKGGLEQSAAYLLLPLYPWCYVSRVQWPLENNQESWFPSAPNFPRRSLNFTRFL